MVAATLDAPRLRPRSVPVLPGGLPGLGHLRDLAADPLALLTRVRDEVGDVGGVRAGVRSIVVVSDPEAVERILVDNVKNYTKQTRGYAQLRKVFGNGLVTSEGSFWLRQRRIAQPAFHRERLAGFMRTIERDTGEAVAAIAESTDGFDISQAMMKLTMRIIGELLFSVDVSGDSDAAGRAINELLHQLIKRTVGINAPLFVPTPANRRFVSARNDLDALVVDVIETRRRAGTAEHHDLLSMLMEAVDEETGERMTDAQLKDEVTTLFSAGHETTSMAVSWALHALLDNPGVEDRLRAELAGDDPVARLPYLDAVLKETFRLYPPVWMVARYAESDDVLAGYRVPRGRMLFVSQWTVHRHPKLWRDPLRFDPERFLVEDPARPKYAYFPFLGGPRKCIGDQLAILEAKVILAALLRSFRFERVPGHPVVPDPTVTMRMKHGLWVRALPG